MADAVKIPDEALKEGLDAISRYEGGVSLDRNWKPVQGAPRLQGMPHVVYRDNQPHIAWYPNPRHSLEDWTRAWDNDDRLKGRAKGYNTVLRGVRWDLVPEPLRRQYLDAKGMVSPAWEKAVMSDAISRTVSPVYARHPHIASMTPGQQASLMSFYYNLGSSPRGKESIEAAIKANDPAAIARALTMYVKSGGKVLPGLVSRRNAEAAAFDKDATRPTLGPRLRSSPLHVAIGKGDTLWKLWRTRLGAYGRDFDEFLGLVKRLNPGINVDRVSPGMKIRLE